jgi:hypothetical protein
MIMPRSSICEHCIEKLRHSDDARGLLCDYFQDLLAFLMPAVKCLRERGIVVGS